MMNAASSDGSDGFVTERAILRQFFRAIFSSDFVGDEVASSIIDRIDWDAISRTSVEGRARKAIQASFRIFRDLEAQEPARDFSDAALIRSLTSTVPMDRKILLLVDMLGFSPIEAAGIVAIPIDDVRRALTREREQTRKPIEGRVIIVEDEPLIAEGLADLVRSTGCTVVGMARNRDEALSIAEGQEIDLAFCDFDLGTSATGLDVASELAADRDLVVVFITAYPEEVLTGEQYEPAFVIQKPYREQAIRSALYHCLTSQRLSAVQEEDL